MAIGDEFNFQKKIDFCITHGKDHLKLAIDRANIFYDFV